MQRPASVISAGSRLSLYSTTSSVRSTGVSGTLRTRARSEQSLQGPSWWGRPLVRTAWYTDLATGAWHAAWFSLGLACWTFIMSVFDVYCLEEATPGSVHTGYYWISYEFVYVGNHHIRNILVLAGLLDIAASVALFVTSCFLLNALRHENQTGFSSYLITMTVFIIWRFCHLGYSTIVNDLIFFYHIFNFFTGMLLTVLSLMSLVVIYSIYQELRSLTQLEDITRHKMEVSSRAGTIYDYGGSIYGSRVGTPFGNHGTLQSTKSKLNFSNQGSPPVFEHTHPDHLRQFQIQGGNQGTLQSTKSGIYSATPGRVATSTPRAPPSEHLYATLERGEQIYSTIIN